GSARRNGASPTGGRSSSAARSRRRSKAAFGTPANRPTRERDTPIVLVSDLVGHARVTTTQTPYTHVRGGDRQRLESLRQVL
ncbi:MAG TPA: hypothetical protein VFP27_01860, partial [Mycobacterium sp.]|nr:hypothetical protein [Mycobacterium sp.]